MYSLFRRREIFNSNSWLILFLFLSVVKLMNEYFNSNVLVVGNLLSTSREAGCIPILHASTSSVCSRNATANKAGTLNPVSLYEVFKLAAEKLLLAFLDEFKIPFTDLRCLQFTDLGSALSWYIEKSLIWL